ncbi:MAG TPA: potassium transporter [Campylobacteraceae bacterium]|nr:potassium transporter [Campylobacteraceae bacterium]
MESVLLIFITTIFIATVLNVFLKKFGIPTVIGYIFSGVAISYLFGLRGINTHDLDYLAEFGIVFLMFTIGLEFSVTHLLKMKREVFLYGFLQVFVTGTIFTLLEIWLFGLESRVAIVLGYALALSSTAIVLKILNENAQIHSGYGRVTLGILLFQDLAVIPILLMISIFTSETTSVTRLLLVTLMDAAIVFLILFVVGKMFIERFFDWITSANSEEIFLIAVLFIVVAAAFVAHEFGFTFSLGAFLAGMTIAETKYKYRIESDLVPFRDILLGVFFVTIGMQIDLETIVSRWYIILGLMVAIMLLKALIQFAVLSPFLQHRTNFKSALALFQIGEFALAVFALAFQNNLLDARTNQILIVTVVLSMIITPFVLKNIAAIADRFFKEPELELVMESSGFKNHIIIIGYGPIGQKVARKLREYGICYIVIEHEMDLVREGEANGEKIFLANAMQRQTLEALGAKESQCIIVALENAAKIRQVCEAITSIDPDINTIVKVRNESHAKIIEEFGINHIINASEEIADIITKEALTCEIKHT